MPPSFQYGVATLIFVLGIVRLMRVLDVLRGKTSDARPPTPVGLAEASKADGPSRRTAVDLVREIVVIVLIAAPAASAVLMVDRLPGASRRLDLELTGGLHPTGFDGYEAALVAMEAEAAEAEGGVAETAGKPIGEKITGGNGFGGKLAAILAMVAPLGVLVALWGLGRQWRLATKAPAAVAGVALAVLSFASAGAGAAEIAGTRRRVELVQRLRALPISSPDQVSGYSGPVKLQGRAEVPDDEGLGFVFRRFEETDVLGETLKIEEANPFRLGTTDVAISDATRREVYNTPGAISIETGRKVLVIGELSGGVIRGTDSVPLVVAPAEHAVLYYEMAAREGLAAHRAWTCIGHVVAAGCALLLLAWAVRAPARGAAQPNSA